MGRKKSPIFTGLFCSIFEVVGRADTLTCNAEVSTTSACGTVFRFDPNDFGAKDRECSSILHHSPPRVGVSPSNLATGPLEQVHVFGDYSPSSVLTVCSDEFTGKRGLGEKPHDSFSLFSVWLATLSLFATGAFVNAFVTLRVIPFAPEGASR